MNGFISKICLGFANIGLGEINIATVSDVLTTKLFANIQLKTFMSSELAKICVLSKDFPGVRRTVS